MFLCVILLLASSCNKDDKPSGNIAKTGDAAAVTAFSAKISGYCYQKNIEGLSVTFGIEYTDSDLTRNAIVLYASEFDGNGLFSVDIENLNPGTESNMMKYNSRDNKKRLMSDDVASQELGGLWRWYS